MSSKFYFRTVLNFFFLSEDRDFLGHFYNPRDWAIYLSYTILIDPFGNYNTDNQFNACCQKIVCILIIIYGQFPFLSGLKIKNHDYKTYSRTDHFFSEYFCSYSFIIREFSFNRHFFKWKTCRYRPFSSVSFIQKTNFDCWLIIMKVLNVLCWPHQKFSKCSWQLAIVKICFMNEKDRRKGVGICRFLFKKVSVERELSDYNYKRIIRTVRVYLYISSN